jgi:HSP20 family molecular chaperone IbpA
MIFTRTPILRSRPVYRTAPLRPIANSISVNPKAEHSPFIPLANVQAFKDRFEIHLALPGFTREDISIAFENSSLIVTGNNASTNSTVFSRKEIASGSFQRTFILPETRGNYSFKAEMKEGILVINVLKPEELKPFQITVA